LLVALLPLVRAARSLSMHPHPHDIVLVCGRDAARELASVRLRGSGTSPVRAILVSSGACDLARLERARVADARRSARCAHVRDALHELEFALVGAGFGAPMLARLIHPEPASAAERPAVSHSVSVSVCMSARRRRFGSSD
jgi:hypothetical protein